MVYWTTNGKRRRTYRKYYGIYYVSAPVVWYLFIMNIIIILLYECPLAAAAQYLCTHTLSRNNNIIIIYYVGCVCVILKTQVTEACYNDIPVVAVVSVGRPVQRAASRCPGGMPVTRVLWSLCCSIHTHTHSLTIVGGCVLVQVPWGQLVRFVLALCVRVCVASQPVAPTHTHTHTHTHTERSRESATACPSGGGCDDDDDDDRTRNRLTAAVCTAGSASTA